jgi:hypothetical protein
MGIQNVLGAHLMLYSQITDHIRRRGELLLSGQFDQLVKDIVFPLPVFFPTIRLVIQSPDHARLIFSRLRSAFLDQGVVALRPRVSAVDLPRAGRFRAWIDWHEIALPVGANRVSQAVYYCRTSALGPRIEMVNYTHVSTPELNQQVTALALSA